MSDRKTRGLPVPTIVFAMLLPCVAVLGVSVHVSAQCPAPPRSCLLFDKSVVGWTMKRATFTSELVAGGTQADRIQAAKHAADPWAYDSFYACTEYAKKGAWCECPRGLNRGFEDQREKDSPVVWR
jgi:hypothetical protein